MSYQYAGRYFEAVLDNSSQLIVDGAFDVYTDSLATTPATLYTDASMGSTASQPIHSDTIGNLQIYAAPGVYYLKNSSDGTIEEITIQPDVRDIAQQNELVTTNTASVLSLVFGAL